MKICMYESYISKPGSNNLYLKVPPSIGIGQQCINAFGYHGYGVATTYIPSTGYYRISLNNVRGH